MNKTPKNDENKQHHFLCVYFHDNDQSQLQACKCVAISLMLFTIAAIAANNKVHLPLKH